MTLSLVAILGVMTVGSGIAFWQFLLVQRQARNLYEADRLAMTVLRLHSDLLAVRDRLQELMDSRDRGFFLKGVEPLRWGLLQDVAHAEQALAQSNGGKWRHREQLGTLNALRTSFPDQLQAMAQLINAGDWDAAQRRLDHQVRAISDTTGLLVDQISSEVSRDEQRRLETIHRVEQEAFWTLLLTGLLTIGSAVLLGYRLSSGIIDPLMDLTRGAQALAGRDFSVRVEARGEDEPAQLARVFNGMAERLQGLYGALQRSESLFRSLIEHGSDLIVLLDLEDRILYASPSCGVLLGCPAEELMGACVLQFVHPDDVEATRELFRTQLSPGGVSPMIEIRVSPASGEWHVLEIQLTDRLGDPNIGGIIINGRDIHARRQLEQQLRQAQKLEAVGRLAAGVAHDFNNLLTVIRGNSELQLLGMTEQNPVRTSLIEIRDAADRAGALTHQLLTFSRRQEVSERPLNINQVIADVESMLHRLIGEDVKLVFRPSGSAGIVIADAGMLQQVVMNLAVNARDAMPSGGTLLVETAPCEIRRTLRAGFGHVPPGRYVLLSVSDTGMGMDTATLGRIFEPFFTTKEVGKGTGLGLATVYGIVQQSGGYILVSSEVGRGSTFQIYLPRVGESQEAEPVEADPQRPTGKRSILVVQDEESLGMMMEEYLTELGYRVRITPSALEAAHLCQTQEEPPALVIIDLDGADLPDRLLVQTLRQRCPKIRLMYTAAGPNEGLDAETPVLVKPFSLEGFARQIRKLLEEEVAAEDFNCPQSEPSELPSGREMSRD